MSDRLDKRLVEAGLAPTREKAQALIMAGKVRVDGQPAAKAGARVRPEAKLEVTGADHPYVSRGGVKLEAALRAFALDPAGLTALDIGASTGGFTHCLLLRGARRVVAVDVGYGQLAWELRNDRRVVVLERTNIRHLPAEALEAPVELVVVDVSFIGLRNVLQDAVRFLAPGGRVLALLKPQFEAGREHVRRGGRVTDPAVHAAVLAEVARIGEGLGLRLLGRVASPLPGKKSGNREFFLLWQRPAGAEAGPSIPPSHDRD
ncbi:MAG: TlyA family RNA methyltransferase [Candidatus Lambdaproteobacteria bacterium]|nr:TlyA family RNA methyltransferase [Candidatus Lambdaproteobacteria bacterium]